MELLEAKDLAIHLPNDLQVQVGGSIYTLKGISGDQAILKGWWVPNVPISHCVPLVRPLTYIVKPIIHKGNKFTPFNILEQYNDFGYHFDFQKEELEAIIQNGDLDMGKMPHWMVVACAKWNFDVGHLLPKKLANHLI